MISGNFAAEEWKPLWSDYKCHTAGSPGQPAHGFRLCPSFPWGLAHTSHGRFYLREVVFMYTFWTFHLSSLCFFIPLYWGTELSRFVPISAEQGEFLRYAGKFCLIQPMDLHPCQQALLESTWNGRKTVSRALQCPGWREKQDFTIPRVGICLSCSGWGSSWPGLPFLPRGAVWKPAQTHSVSLATAGHLHSVYFTCHTWSVWVTNNSGCMKMDPCPEWDGQILVRTIEG